MFVFDILQIPKGCTAPRVQAWILSKLEAQFNEPFFSESSVTTQKHYKIIVIGDPTVGKTSFVQRYVQNSFKNDYKGTVGVDFALKIIKLSETQTVRLQLWDIAGKSFIL